MAPLPCSWFLVHYWRLRHRILGCFPERGAGARVTIRRGGEMLTDNGTASFDNGDTVTFNVNSSCCTSYSSQSIQVNGDLTADDTTFNDSNANGSSVIDVNSGGNIKATGSTFTLTRSAQQQCRVRERRPHR